MYGLSNEVFTKTAKVWLKIQVWIKIAAFLGRQEGGQNIMPGFPLIQCPSLHSCRLFKSHLTKITLFKAKCDFSIFSPIFLHILNHIYIFYIIFSFLFFGHEMFMDFDWSGTYNCHVLWMINSHQGLGPCPELDSSSPIMWCKG